MKKILFLFILIIYPLNFSYSQVYPISEKKAISFITEHPLFKVYNNYLQKKYNLKKAYTCLSKLLSFEGNDSGTVYLISFLNNAKEIKNGDLLQIRFEVNAYTGKIKICENSIFIQTDNFRKAMKDYEKYLEEFK